jgi:predicted unusual protein kinase regulating ubiquinone biosynthesis (AarF/ABC1/UbiB family)
VRITPPWLPLPRQCIAALDQLSQLAVGQKLTDCLASTKMVILDVGMTVSLKQGHLEALSDLYRGIARTDGNAIADAMLRLRHQDSVPHLNVDAFQADVCAIFDSLDAAKFRENTQSIVDQVFGVIRRHGMTVDGAASAVLLTTVTLEV